MNYLAIYNRLIERARGREIDVYTERHHVIPKCIGGSDGPENIVRLTAEEHFVAHELLVKIYPGNALLIFAIMALSRNFSDRRPNNKLFGWHRRLIAQEISKIKTGVPRPPHVALACGAANKGRKLTAEHRAKMSAAHKGKTHTPEHNAAVSAANKGRKSPMEGRKHSAETKAKMREATLKQADLPEAGRRLVALAASRTPEERSAIARKAWETKHRKLLAIVALEEQDPTHG